MSKATEIIEKYSVDEKYKMTIPELFNTYDLTKSVEKIDNDGNTVVVEEKIDVIDLVRIFNISEKSNKS